MRECQSVSELSIREVSDGRERVERAAVEAVGSALLVGMAWLWTGRLNFGTAGNNCKTKPEPARLWHSTVPINGTEQGQRLILRAPKTHLRTFTARFRAVMVMPFANT